MNQTSSFSIIQACILRLQVLLILQRYTVIWMLKVAIILGSTRPARNGEAVARWVYDMAKKKQASNTNNNSNTQHGDNIECDLKYRLWV